MMPGRIIPGMAASRPFREADYARIRESRQVAGVRRLLAGGRLKLGDLVGTNLMPGPTKFLDALAEPRPLVFADLVMLGITGLGLGFLQLLEYRPIAALGLRPFSIKATVKTFHQEKQKPPIL